MSETAGKQWFLRRETRRDGNVVPFLGTHLNVANQLLAISGVVEQRALDTLDGVVDAFAGGQRRNGFGGWPSKRNRPRSCFQ